jgi:hypothetical protein
VLTKTWAAIRRNRGLGRRLNMTLGRLAIITNVLQSGDPSAPFAYSHSMVPGGFDVMS